MFFWSVHMWITHFVSALKNLSSPATNQVKCMILCFFSIMKLCPLIVKKKKILRFPFNIISFPEAMKFFYHRLSSNLVIIPFMVTELCPWIEKWPHYDIAEILLKLVVLNTNQSWLMTDLWLPCFNFSFPWRTDLKLLQTVFDR